MHKINVQVELLEMDGWMMGQKHSDFVGMDWLVGCLVVVDGRFV